MVSRDLPIVRIYTAALLLGRNPGTGAMGPGGAAGLIEYWDGDDWVRKEYAVAKKQTTPERMALRGALEGLNRLAPSCHVRVASDSAYLVRGMTRRIQMWKRKRGRRAGGRVPDWDLWMDLDQEALRHMVFWEWRVPGPRCPRMSYVEQRARDAIGTNRKDPTLKDSAFKPPTESPSPGPFEPGAEGRGRNGLPDPSAAGEALTGEGAPTHRRPARTRAEEGE